MGFEISEIRCVFWDFVIHLGSFHSGRLHSGRLLGKHRPWVCDCESALPFIWRDTFWEATCWEATQEAFISRSRVSIWRAIRSGSYILGGYTLGCFSQCYCLLDCWPGVPLICLSWGYTLGCYTPIGCSGSYLGCFFGVPISWFWDLATPLTCPKKSIERESPITQSRFRKL